MVLAADEAALPALRGILATLGPDVRGHALLEVDDPANAHLAAPHADVTVSACVRGDRTLHAALGEWSRGHGDQAVAQHDGFYAWLATESTQAARLSVTAVRHRHPAGPDTGTGLLDRVIRPRLSGART